jgi:Spermidine/putrescine-binding periplasmic protein
MNRLKKSLAGVALALGALCTGSHIAAADSGVLHIYNWTDYTSPEMVKKFEQDTGIKVTIDTYDSNETALAKLSSGAAGYDVIIISNDFIPIFVNQHLLQESASPRCRTSRIWSRSIRSGPGIPRRDIPCPGSGARPPIPSIPIYKGPTDSLKPLFEPPAELKGKIGMFGSPSEVMSLALVYLGKPQCNTDPPTSSS